MSKEPAPEDALEEKAPPLQGYLLAFSSGLRFAAEVSVNQPSTTAPRLGRASLQPACFSPPVQYRHPTCWFLTGAHTGHRSVKPARSCG